MATIRLNQDLLLHVLPKDADGGPTTIVGNSLQAISSNLAAFDNAFPEPPNQSEPSRTVYTMKARQHGRVGDKATFNVTAQVFTGTEEPGAVVEGTVEVEIVAGNVTPMPAAVVLEVVAVGIDKQ